MLIVVLTYILQYIKLAVGKFLAKSFIRKMLYKKLEVIRISVPTYTYLKVYLAYDSFTRSRGRLLHYYLSAKQQCIMMVSK